MSKEQGPEILEVNVIDEVKSGDIVGDGGKIPVLMRYVKWHNKPSRTVTQEDIPRVMKEAAVLGELCHTITGPYSGANAVAHPQIDDKDPLRFFVTSSGEIIINPVILEHTTFPVSSTEACTSFPERPPKMMFRYNKILLRFQQITTEGKLSEPREERFNGTESKVVQHELSHLNGHSMWDTVTSPEDSLGQALLTATPENV